MEELITLFEDRTTKLNLEHSQFLDLLKLRDLLGRQNVRLDFDGTIQIMHFVGYVSIGKLRVQILPKIMETGSFSKPELINASMCALFNMLRKSEFHDVIHLPLHQEMDLYNYDLLELFISIFAKKIFDFYHINFYREYNETIDNQIFIKGKIDVSNTIHKSKSGSLEHSVIFDSFNDSNDLNNIIKTVLILLLNKTRNSGNVLLLKKSLMLFDNCSEILLSTDTFRRVRFTRLNIQYKPVFDMARMFFFNSNPEYQSGDYSIFSFMIPVNSLFEKYVYTLLNEINDYSVLYQNSRKFITNESGSELMRLRPDYLVYKNNELLFIGDAKYKNAYVDGKVSISASDYQQIYTYAKLFNCSNVCLFFPEFVGNLNKEVIFASCEEYPVNIIVRFIKVQ